LGLWLVQRIQAAAVAAAVVSRKNSLYLFSDNM
jgi:hypothetical protein